MGVCSVLPHILRRQLFGLNFRRPSNLHIVPQNLWGVGKLLTSSSSPQLPQFSSDCLIPPLKTSAGDANTWHCEYGASADDKAEARLSIPVSWSNLGIPRIIREFRSGHFPLASRHVPLYIYWLNADVGWRVLLYYPRNIPCMHLLFADYMLQKW